MAQGVNKQTLQVWSTSNTTLQNAYDNSTSPEILTDATRGALSLQRGSGADTDNIIEGKNGAGTTTFSVTGAGVITGSNLSGTNTGDQTITLTSDVTGSGTGSFAATIANNAVTLGKMAMVATNSILGRATAGTGNVEVLTALPFAYTGDVTRPEDSNVTTIANSAVTLAKQANVATSTVFYRKTAGTGVPEVQTLATLKTDLLLTGTNSGDQTITLTGDVTGSGTGSFATTIGALKVLGTMIANATIDLTTKVTGLLPFANIANVATGTVMYRKTAATGAMEAQTLATLKTDLGLTGTNSGDQTSIVGITGTLAQFNTAITDADITPTTRTINVTWPISGGGDLSANRTITTSMATNKLIGRGTAGTGVMEEITLGTNLSFTGTTLNAASGGWSFSLTETEIDFWSWIPVRSKRFTITNGSITWSSKIIVSSSWNVATGRVGNDWEWDSINFTAKAGTGNFVVTANASWRVKWKRKIFYSFS